MVPAREIKGEMAKIGVLIEERDGELKKANFGLLSLARNSAGDEVYALVFGEADPDCRELLGEFGADKIVMVKTVAGGLNASSSPEVLALALANTMEALGLEVLLGSSSAVGKDILARVAALLDAPLVQDCLGIDLAKGQVRKSHFSGRTTATIRLKGRPWIVGLRQNCYPERPNRREPVLLEHIAPVEDKGRLVVKGARAGVGGVDLAEAEIIVAGGRGVGATENFRLLQECAARLGGAVGASRAAVDAGYAPHAIQVGQTGRTVSPKLYIACGISGSVQHFAGMKTAKVIVAINKDKDAAIMLKCDYGLVGDLFQVLPLLTEALGRIKGEDR